MDNGWSRLAEKRLLVLSTGARGRSCKQRLLVLIVRGTLVAWRPVLRARFSRSCSLRATGWLSAHTWGHPALRRATMDISHQWHPPPPLALSRMPLSNPSPTLVVAAPAQLYRLSLRRQSARSNAGRNGGLRIARVPRRAREEDQQDGRRGRARASLAARHHSRDDSDRPPCWSPSPWRWLAAVVQYEYCTVHVHQVHVRYVPMYNLGCT